MNYGIEVIDVGKYFPRYSSWLNFKELQLLMFKDVEDEIVKDFELVKNVEVIEVEFLTWVRTDCQSITW